MKKVLLSLLTIGLVGGAAFAASGAFFNDVETSTGNTFIAGNLDLKISSECTYNGVTSAECGTWTEKDLVPGVDKFFNFTDVKPGDWGENTIDFTVVDNDAWMCANVDITQNSDLGKYLSLFWWVDDGDNVYENGEKVLYEGPRTLNDWLSITGTNNLPLTIADSVLNWKTWPGSTPPNTTPVPGGEPQYLGVGWCFGTLTVTGTGDGFTCDATGNQNDAQGDTVVGDLTFSAEQFRNNPEFVCPEHELED